MYIKMYFMSLLFILLQLMDTVLLKVLPPYKPVVKFSIKNTYGGKHMCDSMLCEKLPPAEYNMHLRNVSIEEGILIKHCSEKTKHYFISKDLNGRVYSWQYCCSLGMVSGSLKTKEEINCVYNAYKKATDMYKTSTGLLFSKANWILTDYVDAFYNFSYVACVDRSYIPDNLWSPNQPDNSNSMNMYVALNFGRNETLLGYDDVHGFGFYNVLCQINTPRQKTQKVDNYGSFALSEKKNKFNTCDFRLRACRNLRAEVKFDADLRKALESEGILMTQCANDKYYYFSKTKTSSILDSYNYCCSIGMQPAALRNRKEMECVYDAYVNNNGKRITDPKIITFTTAFYDADYNRTFTSCFSQTQLNDELFFDFENNNAFLNEACINLQLYPCKNTSNIGFTDITCYNVVSHQVSCERVLTIKERNIKSYNTSIVRMSNCADHVCNNTQNQVSKIKNKNLKSAINQTNNGIFVNTCGNHRYYLSNVMIKGNEIWKKCCAIGMEPATITSRDDITCVYDKFLVALQKVEFKGMKQFLVSYIDYNLNFNYTSCPDKQEVPLDLWAPNQPDNSNGLENCVALHFSYDKSNIGYDDVDCNEMYFYMCQNIKKTNEIKAIHTTNKDLETKTSEKSIGNSKSANKSVEFATVSVNLEKGSLETTSITTILPRTLDISANISHYLPPAVNYFITSRLLNCEIAKCKNQEISEFGDITEALEKSGKLVSQCGLKKYLLLYKMSNYVDIWQECCSLGLIPASIQNKYIIPCLHKYYYLAPGVNVSSIFFTGQLDANLDRNIISCATNKTVPSDVWLEGEPNNDMKREACVALKFDNKTAGLIDIRCGEYANIICEV